jgi:UDP-N-acetylmuramoylalanine--D-glutamate ligase
MELKDKKILVVGLARSGIAAAEFLARRGARVTVTDMAEALTLGQPVKRAKDLNLVMELGGHRLESFQSADLIVISPGVPHTIEPLQRAKERGIPIIGELELASRFIAEPMLAITGTNGKTTTTELVGHILQCSGLKTFVGGNIGRPLIGYAAEGKRVDFLVVEVSSFQLDTIVTFHPRVAVLLNITEDHRDRYADMATYARSKGRIFENQGPGDTAIFNAADPLVGPLLAGVRARKKAFARHDPASTLSDETGAVIERGQILVPSPQGTVQRFDLAQTDLIGPHNAENASAAILAAMAAGVRPQVIQQALSTFKSLPHRLEKVATVNGVHYVNDSKATNVDAVVRALTCFDKPVVLILGGRNKNNDFGQLATHVRRYAAAIIAYGEARNEIKQALCAACPGSLQTAESFEQAFDLARRQAQPGQTVLLSPACASFDLFKNYAERGDAFRQLVGELK